MEAGNVAPGGSPDEESDVKTLVLSGFHDLASWV